MSMRRNLLAVFAAASAFASSAWAHHSFAMFDRNKQAQITGTVKDFQFTNPHVWIQLITIDPKTRQQAEWGIEGLSPNNLRRMGWNRNSLKPGDNVILTINPTISGKPGGALVNATVNGKLIGGAGSY